MMKKLLALFLALLMVFSLLPVSALAEGEAPEEPVETLEEALPAEEAPAEEALPEEPAEPAAEPVEEALPEEPAEPAEEPSAPAEEAIPAETPAEEVLLAEEPEEAAVELLGADYPHMDENILVSKYIPDRAFIEAVRGITGKSSLTLSQAKDIYSLDLSGKGISDLTGIEYFLSIETLDVSGNALTALDFSGCGHLHSLDCSGNNLTALTGLSVNIFLQSVDCSGNALTSLAVSGCEYLQTLNCSGNALTSLNLSGCIYPIELHCGGNKLMDLDLIDFSFTALDLGTQYPDEPVGAAVLRPAQYPAETVSVAVLEDTVEHRWKPAGIEGAWEVLAPDEPVVLAEGTPDRCIYAIECRTGNGLKEMIISRPVEYTETAIGMDRDYILMDLGHDPVDLGLALKDPEADSEVIKSLMNQGLLTVEIAAYDADNPEACTVVELDEFGHSTVAPKAVGTAYVDVNLMIEGKPLQTCRVRVDVVENISAEEVPTATLPVKTATVELYKTDYTEIDVLLDLKQWHDPEDPSLLDYVLPDPESFPDPAGVAIWKAEFTDERMYEMFILVPVSDRRLAIVPINGPGIGDFIDLVYSGAIKAPKKLSSQIRLTLSDAEGNKTVIPTEQPLTITLKTSQPKLKTAAVKFNSLLAEEKLLAVTGGEVLNAEVISGPDWAEFDESEKGFTLRYTGAAGAKLSGSVTLYCAVKGWVVPAPVTVKLSASAVKPKLTLAKKSLTLEAGSAYVADLAPAITPADFIGDFRLVSVVDTAAKLPVDPDGDTVPTVDCGTYTDQFGKLCPYARIKAPSQAADGKAHSYKYTFSAGIATAAVTVKVLPQPSTVKLTVKTAGIVTVSMPLSTVTLTPTLKNAPRNPDGSMNVWLRVSFEAELPDGTREPVERELIVVEEMRETYNSDLEAIPVGPLHVVDSYPEHVPDPSCTYYAIVEAVNAEGETLGGTRVKIPVQASAAAPALKVKLSGKLDLLREGSEVKVSVTAKNYYPASSVLDVEVYKVFDGLTGQAVLEDATDLFHSSHLEEEEGSCDGFTLRLAEGPAGRIHPKDKFSLRITAPDFLNPLAEPMMKAAPVNIPITVGKAALKLAPAKAEMPLGDPYAETAVAFTWADAALRGIARAELTAASDKLFDLAKNADGTYALHWDNNKFPTTLKSGKTVAVKLNVWMRGIELGKPLTLTLKVTAR